MQFSFDLSEIIVLLIKKDIDYFGTKALLLFHDLISAYIGCRSCCDL